MDRLAEGGDLVALDLRGGRFVHRIYERRASGDRVFLFIEGDGRPWIAGQEPADDPTPDDPLTLHLLLRTPGSALYVGRPCYFRVIDSACAPFYWTHGRFAPEVIDSMRRVIDALLAREDRECVLVGHSGGAAIAALLVPDLARPCTLVTVAGLLDTEAWAEWHGYEPLTGSLNPADAVERLAGVRQVHFIATNDRNIPPEHTKRLLREMPHAALVEYSAFDHGCCWERAWSAILAEIDAALAAEAP